MNTTHNNDSDSDDETECNVIHHDSPSDKIWDVAHGKDFDTLPTLMAEFVNDMTHRRCNCGFPYPDDVFDMLQRDFGILDPQVYQIAFDTGLLSRYIMYGPGDTDTCRMTRDMAYNMFSDLNKPPRSDDSKLLTSPEEFEANAMGTIDVLFNNFAQGYDIRAFAWVECSRGQFVGCKDIYYPEDLPSFISHNIMSLLMEWRANTTNEFVQKIFLKLFDLKTPLPDFCPLWVEDTTRPIASDTHDEPGKVQYAEILRLVTPIQYIVHIGWIHALKGLYERIPEKVKKDLSCADQHIQEFRDLLKHWKDMKEDTGMSKYDALYDNGNEILAEMEQFIQDITK